tara:strand:+ start:9673 stop:10002 length:330 start_codon:yes stop_codon:yes gene_type:complete
VHIGSMMSCQVIFWFRNELLLNFGGFGIVGISHPNGFRHGQSVVGFSVNCWRTKLIRDLFFDRSAVNHAGLAITQEPVISLIKLPPSSSLLGFSAIDERVLHEQAFSAH